ncbi:Putative Zinc finger, RING-type [Septoria linicola]|uniref:Zinc finger, RING-type n=1 Tax=Septoria linicola TaxID=215465 RepID=A0A9Q9EGG7_9PEZI|nr:Putative Zinc finger, RING-type [Septoria linicola]
MAAFFHGGPLDEALFNVVSGMIVGRAFNINSHSLAEITTAIEAVQTELTRVTVENWITLSDAERDEVLQASNSMDNLILAEQAREAFHNGEPGFLWVDQPQGGEIVIDGDELEEQHEGEPNPPLRREVTFSQRQLTLADRSEDETLECPITYASLAVGTTVSVLGCGHWFSVEALDDWLLYADTCPTCRAIIV